MLLNAVPPGYLVDAAWLASQGIAYESFRDYVKRGWLERITRGVFRRPLPSTAAPLTSNSIGWKTCILSTQHIMGHDWMSAAPRRSANRGMPITCASATALQSGSMGTVSPIGWRNCRWMPR